MTPPKPRRSRDEGSECHCGEDDCLHLAFDYPWCRPCGEHHRAPECPIDQNGYSLAPCGCRWDDLDLNPRCHHHEEIG